MTALAILEAFEHLPDPRYGAGQRHNQALCLALFTLAVAAGRRDFWQLGQGRIEPRTVSLCCNLNGIRPRSGLCTLIQVTATRTLLKGNYEMVSRNGQQKWLVSQKRSTTFHSSAKPHSICPSDSHLLGYGKQNALCA